MDEEEEGVLCAGGGVWIGEGGIGGGFSEAAIEEEGLEESGISPIEEVGGEEDGGVRGWFGRAREVSSARWAEAWSERAD